MLQYTWPCIYGRATKPQDIAKAKQQRLSSLVIIKSYSTLPVKGQCVSTKITSSNNVNLEVIGRNTHKPIGPSSHPKNTDQL